MTFRPRFDDPDDEFRDDDDCPEEDDADDLSETIPCPECGAEVYEDAVRCPRCGTYITADTHPWSGRPVWWILLGLVGVVAVIWALMGLRF
jgi:hypothetical protein